MAKQRPSRFVWNEEDTILPQCIYCLRLSNSEALKMTCEAFPEGIPDIITSNEVLHTHPMNGDNGLIFELNPEMKSEYAQFLKQLLADKQRTE